MHLFVSQDGESPRKWVWSFGHLVTRATFNSGKVDIVAMSDHLIGLNCMAYIFHHDSTHPGPMALDWETCRQWEGCLRLQELRFPPVPSGVMLVRSVAVDSSGVFTTMEQARALQFKGSLSLLFCWRHRVCDGCELWDAQLTEDCLQCLLHHLLFSSLVKVIRNNVRSSGDLWL